MYVVWPDTILKDAYLVHYIRVQYFGPGLLLLLEITQEHPSKVFWILRH